jgi:3-oxoacyl-[acyl-carrier protein] reductase
MFKDKTVLVTGSSRGIGKAIALKFASEGVSVIVNNKKNTEEAKNLVKEIIAKGGKADYIKADISSEKEVLKLKDEIKKKFGNLDILINNAGIMLKEHPGEPNWKSWDDVMAVNLKGVAMTSYILSGIMKKNSSIVNISSVWGNEIPAYDADGYAASKAGVVSLTKTLALQLAPKIRVNAVMPSVVATEMTHENDPETKKWLEANIPMKRMGTTEEVADLVLYIASDKAKYIVGSVIKIDGGISLKL